MKRILIVLFLTLVLSITALNGLDIPMYFSWRSTSELLYYDLNNLDSFNHDDLYKVNIGIDTLFINNIRTRFEVTNQDDGFRSQALIEHAIVDYSYKGFGLQLSTQEFGYGNTFFLYNRRYNDRFYKANTLVNYRWNGINPSLSYGKSTFGIGLGSNDFNGLLNEAHIGFKSTNQNYRVFVITAQNDSHYDNFEVDYGSEVSIALNRVSLHSGFVYKQILRSKDYDQMSSWHLTNELNIGLLPQCSLILSTENETEPDNKKVEYLYEACVELEFKKLQNYCGYRTRSVPDDKLHVIFCDVNLKLRDSFSIGLWYDYCLLDQSNSYNKLGIQARYIWEN